MAPFRLDDLDPLLATWIYHAHYNARSRARIDAVPFGITIEDIALAMPPDRLCPVLGIPIKIRFYGTRGPRNNSASLMVFDKAAGYVPGNIAVASFKATRILNNATLDDLRKIVKFIEAKTDA